MNDNDNDIVKDFLVESYENLDQLDRDLVGLEKNPNDRNALAAVFRTIHTIKGTCGFLGFPNLEKVAHVGENLLARLRDGQLVLNPEITTGLLSMVDAVRQMLKQIEVTEKDGESDYPELRERLTKLQLGEGSTQTKAAVAGHAGAKERAADTQSEPAEEPPAKPARNAKQKAEVATKEVVAEAVSARVPDESESQRSQQQVSAAQASALESTVRVHVGLLDKVMTLVGELVWRETKCCNIRGGLKMPVSWLQRSGST